MNDLESDAARIYRVLKKDLVAIDYVVETSVSKIDLR